jgi:hypothetical protein
MADDLTIDLYQMGVDNPDTGLVETQSDSTDSSVSTDTDKYIKSIKLPDGTSFKVKDDESANKDLSNLSDDGKKVLAENAGSSLPLFSTILMDKVLDFSESKGLALQGTYVYSTAVPELRYGYPDFVAKCIEEMNAGVATETTLGDNTVTMYVNSNGHQFYNISDKDAIDTWFNTYGIADFYGVDTENQRVFLPRNKYFMQLTVDTTKVNEMNKAGLPNITGSIGDIWATNTLNSSGALAKTTTSGTKASTGSANTYTVSVNASNSNSIYGNSDTVQPPSSNKLLYYVVGNTEQESSITDVIDVTTTENDTTPLGTSKYMQGIQPNLSWLASNGQWNDGNMYLTFYNYYVTQIGQKFASGYVKDSTDDYDDYDLVINQSDMTFRLPLLTKEIFPAKTSAETVLETFTTTTDGTWEYSTFTAPESAWYSIICTGIITSGATRACIISLYGTVYGARNAEYGAGRDFGAGPMWFNKGDTIYVGSVEVKTRKLRYCQANIPPLYFKVSNAVVNEELLDVSEVLDKAVLKTSLKEAHVVIDSYVNGTSGYRIWDDGYCEQWGTWDNGSLASDVATTITYLKTFANTNYVLVANAWRNNNSATNRDVTTNIYSETTSNFSAGWYRAYATGTAQYLSWHACGYINL